MAESSRALITGASSGIGAALAKLLARRGITVWLAARRLEVLREQVIAIESEGGLAHAVKLDVSEPERTAEQVGVLDSEVGGFDMVIANAGIGGGSAPVAEQTFADFRRVMETNLLGAAATILPLVPGMVARKRGHIVGISSLAGEIPLPAAADYGTSKAALSFFLASAAADLIPRGVFVTDVHPGFVKTPLTDKNSFPMPFLVELERAAEIIDRGIRKRSRVVRFPAPLAAAISAGMAMPSALRDHLVNQKRPR